MKVVTSLTCIYALQAQLTTRALSALNHTKTSSWWLQDTILEGKIVETTGFSKVTRDIQSRQTSKHSLYKPLTGSGRSASFPPQA
jgi:hypothetical protein